MAERNTAEELDDVYEIKYSTDAMTGGADKRMYLYYQLADSIKKADSVDIIVSFLMESGVKMLLGELDNALKRGAKIRKELHDDLGCDIPNNGYLKKWADQGVLLLNTVLTVRAHQANSHQGHGWEKFTDAIIEAVNEQDRPIVYMLWGRPAQSKIPMLTNPKHLILKAPHPSPLSAYRGFFGCKHFSQANDFLKEHGVAPIDWQIEDI